MTFSDLISTQDGAAQGLWTHTPVDWGGNEGRTKPTAWPTDASAGQLGSGTRPGGAVIQSGPPGAPVFIAVAVTAIGTTTASVTFTLAAAPTSSRVNYGVTVGMTNNQAGTTAVQQTVNLSGLSSGVTYFYAVQATNANGTTVTVTDTFTTK